jgi:outer membrane protein
MTNNGMRWLAAAILMTAAPAGAQQAQRITFNDAITIALRQNLTVRQAENNVDIQSIGISQAGQQMRPNLGFSVSGSNAVGQQFNQDLARLVTENTQSVSTGVSSNVLLFDGGRTRANVQAARANTEASTLDLTRAKQTAVFQVASNFVNLVSAQSQLEVQRENLVSLQLQEAQIQRFADAGARPISDLYQQKASVASAQLAVTQADRSVELAKIELIRALQLDPAKEYEFVAPVIPDSMPTRVFRLDSLVALALARRPDLVADQSRLLAAQQDVKAAAAGRRPSISLSGGYNTGYSSSSDSAFFNQLFKQRRGGSLGANVSFPIFDRGSTRLAQQRAAITEENAQLALTNQRQAVALEVRTAWLNVRSAQQQLAAATAQLTAATQALDAVQQRYNVGAATLLDVTQARAQRVNAASSIATARYNLVLTQAVIAYYTGELDPLNIRLGM